MASAHRAGNIIRRVKIDGVETKDSAEIRQGIVSFIRTYTQMVGSGTRSLMGLISNNYRTRIKFPWSSNLARKRSLLRYVV